MFAAGKIAASTPKVAMIVMKREKILRVCIAKIYQILSDSEKNFTPNLFATSIIASKGL